MPLWMQPQIWPHLQVQLYAGCAPLAPHPTEDLVADHCLSLAVLAGLAMAYPRDLCCITLGVPSRRSLHSTE